MQYLERRCAEDEPFANDIDNNILMIKELLILSYVFKTFRLFLLIGIISFLFALIFKMLLNLEEDFYDKGDG
jgi:hypothetical protein